MLAALEREVAEPLGREQDVEVEIIVEVGREGFRTTAARNA